MSPAHARGVFELRVLLVDSIVAGLWGCLVTGTVVWFVNRRKYR